jgi:OOP family OmpA-OmpF porin
VDARGCPLDADGDGVFDGLDACAETPRGATVDARGCPADRDADGVLDGLDACAESPRGATVDERGCTLDGDGDGVADGLDHCPTTPAGRGVDVNGCPRAWARLEAELMETGIVHIEDPFGETNLDRIPEGLSEALEDVGEVLARWPGRVEIGVHTDDRGTRASNRTLSQKRADAILEHLLRRFPGLDASRFAAVGHGESKPLAANQSAAGRARNRRIEFVMLDRDAHARAVERRRTASGEGP